MACLAVERGLWGTQASAVMAHGLSCSVACGTLLDQGSNPCPLDWQADSLPLDHQGSPLSSFQESPFKISTYPLINSKLLTLVIKESVNKVVSQPA